MAKAQKQAEADGKRKPSAEGKNGLTFFPLKGQTLLIEISLLFSVRVQVAVDIQADDQKKMAKLSKKLVRQQVMLA